MALKFLIRIGGMGVELSQIAQVGFGYRLWATPNQKEQSLLGPASHIGAGDETCPFLDGKGSLGGPEHQIVGIFAEFGRIDSPLAVLGGLVEPAAEGIPALFEVICKASEGGSVVRLDEDMVDSAGGQSERQGAGLESTGSTALRNGHHMPDRTVEKLLRHDTDAIEEDLIGATILEGQQIHARSAMDPRVVGRKIKQGLEFWVGRIAGPDDEGLRIGTGGHPWDRALEGPTRRVGVSQYSGSREVLTAGCQMADPDRDPSTGACMLC